jgi:hypothetical protein
LLCEEHLDALGELEFARAELLSNTRLSRKWIQPPSPAMCPPIDEIVLLFTPNTNSRFEKSGRACTYSQSAD